MNTYELVLQDNKLIINDLTIDTKDKAFLTRPDSITYILNNFYTEDERKMIYEAIKNKDNELIDKVVDQKYQEYLAKYPDVMNVKDVTSEETRKYILYLLYLLAPYALYSSYIIQDRKYAYEKLFKLLKLNPVLENEINIQLLYIYSRNADIIEKLETQFTESFAEQLINTLLDLFYSALLHMRYVDSDGIGFGAITSIIRSSLLVNITKKAKYSITAQDIDYDYLPMPVTTTKLALASQYQKKRLKEILHKFYKQNSEETYLCNNYLFDLLILPLFMYYNDFKYYETLVLLNNDYKVAMAKSVLQHHHQLYDIIRRNHLPKVRFSHTTNVDDLNINSNIVYIVKHRPLTFDLIYKKKKSAYGIRRLYRIWSKLKQYVPNLIINPILLDNVLYATAISNMVLTNQDFAKFIHDLDTILSKLIES